MIRPCTVQPDGSQFVLLSLRLITLPAAAMYERFTDSFRNVMKTANSHAERFAHNYMGCLHMLLGAIDVAPEAFHSTSVDTVRLRETAVRRLEHSESVGGKAGIESSFEHARLRGSSTVDVPHLLMGILSSPDDAVTSVFDDLQLDIDDVLRQLSDGSGTQ